MAGFYIVLWCKSLALWCRAFAGDILVGELTQSGTNECRQRENGDGFHGETLTGF
jgi:hypothetical protein